MEPRPAVIARECSPFLDTLIRRHPDWYSALSDQGRLDQDKPPQGSGLADCIAASGLDPGLREFRNQEMMRIVWRDLNRFASLRETMTDLSVLAELCLQAAIVAHTATLEEKHGIPRGNDGTAQRLVVIGMGKLGGGELNLSSDIDIVFCYPQGGECDGRRGLANEQFFTRLARAVIGSLSEVTEHGFCFRVDARLRPFGESGPLVCSFGSMEQYYQREGRDWERYALIKARPVGGDLEAGAELLRRLTPFVYRRYIDFGAVEALQEMHATVREDAAGRGRQNDIKRGPGGIREIEFLVQAYQLLRGGRERELQTPSLLQALHQLEELSLLTAETVQSLRDNYEFLRRLENAIQALHDSQMHQLPEGADLDRVTRVMGFKEPAALLAATEAVRSHVSSLFNESFQARQDQDASSPWKEHWRSLKSGAETPPDSPLTRYLERYARLSLSQRGSQRIDRFMPLLLERLDRKNLPDPALSDIFELVLSISRRSAYLSLLVQNPLALDRMLGLFAVSDWVAETVIRHPALLDELIDPTLGRHLPTRPEMDATVLRILDSNPDIETALQALNHMKLAFLLRVAVAELETTLSPRQVQHTLTALAESLVDACLQLALREMRPKHGDLPSREFGVIGYGTLGAAELGYTSDLDIIFLYAPGERESDGPRPLAAERYQTVLARRLLGLLTASTASGKLYETDTRLRPNGRAGLLVSSLAAFERYQRDEAWTWELQALTRARPVAGSRNVGRAFRAIRRNVLCQARESAALRDQVRKMRARMRKEFSGGDSLKHGEGCLVDIDFVTQLGMLEMAGAHPELLDLTGTWEQLKRLGEIGWLPAGQSRILCEAHAALTRARHLQKLSRAEPGAVPQTTDCWEICAPLLEMAEA